MLFVAILSVVLDQSPSLRDKIIDSILGRLPVIGTQISNQVDGGLNVHGSLFVVGTLALLWAGLKVVRHAQDAFNDQWDVPPHEQPTVVVKAIRGALTLVVLGAGIVAATIVTGVAAFLPDLGGLHAPAWGPCIAIVANTLFLARVVRDPHAAPDRISRAPARSPDRRHPPVAPAAHRGDLRHPHRRERE